MGKLSPATIHVLKGLIPYTRENTLLAFSPGKYFYELERISRHKEPVLKAAYYRAKRQGLISSDPVPCLTQKGRQKLQPFVAKKLGKNARLMIIFDIPEAQAVKRRRLRMLLRDLKFAQVQQSVWVTDFDHKEIIKEACAELELQGFVQLHESALLFS